MPFWSELLSFAFWLVYACFFEWVAHRYFMHAPRFPLRDAFRGHMAHHQTYRHDHRYQVTPEEPPHGIMMRWYAFPGIILGHLPVFFALQWLIGYPLVWGAVAACALYFAGYEYTHFLMHAPRNQPVERLAWFRFIREHHRLHHRYMQCNFNVFVPFADLCLGTLRRTE